MWSQHWVRQVSNAQIKHKHTETARGSHPHVELMHTENIAQNHPPLQISLRCSFISATTSGADLVTTSSPPPFSLQDVALHLLRVHLLFQPRISPRRQRRSSEAHGSTHVFSGAGLPPGIFHLSSASTTADPAMGLHALKACSEWKRRDLDPTALISKRQTLPQLVPGTGKHRRKTGAMSSPSQARRGLRLPAEELDGCLKAAASL